MVFNDVGGDPDGLFATVHALMCTSTTVTALVADSPGTDAVPAFNEILQLMGLSGRRWGSSGMIPVFSGSNTRLTNRTTPQPSPGATALIAEANRTDTRLPLFVTCGASLTDVASAVLIDPTIATKFTLVWIGGNAYPTGVPPVGGISESNMKGDVTAAQVLFEDFPVNIWQIPQNAYYQSAVGVPELELNVAPMGAIGAYLYEKLTSSLVPPSVFTGETYILGDSPMVLVTALTNSHFGPQIPAGTTAFDTLTSPIINGDGTYSPNPNGRPIRVFTMIDPRLLFGDFFAKLKLNFG